MITAEGYQSAVELLAARWPDVVRAAAGGKFRSRIFSAFRDPARDDSTLITAAQRVFEDAPTNATPAALALAVVRAGAELSPGSGRARLHAMYLAAVEKYAKIGAEERARIAREKDEST